MKLELPQVLETHVLADASFFTLKKEILQVPHQNDYPYYVLEVPSFAVMVLATTPQGHYVLNWEYRHPAHQILLSCPGGILHADESPIACAERELLEETGFTAERFEVMGESFPFPGVATQKTVFIRAYQAVISRPPELEPAEFIETELFTKEKLHKALKSNTPTDGLLLSALYLDSIYNASSSNS